MKIVHISDTHGLHYRLTQGYLPPGDMIIHSGDVCNRGTRGEFEDFLLWFSTLPYKHKIFIAGNHDFCLQDRPVDATHLDAEVLGITYLQDELIEIEGIKIYGSPWTPKFYNWAFMKERGAEIKEVWDKIPDRVDILVTHGPPHGILDMAIDGTKCGCEVLRVQGVRAKPRYHLFGHIHEGYGMVGGLYTTFINGSVLNERYVLKNRPVEFTIKQK